MEGWEVLQEVSSLREKLFNTVRQGGESQENFVGDLKKKKKINTCEKNPTALEHVK